MEVKLLTEHFDSKVDLEMFLFFGIYGTMISFSAGLMAYSEFSSEVTLLLNSHVHCEEEPENISRSAQTGIYGTLT